MSNIEQNLQKILTSRYGKDVRQSIHDSIHDCYEDGKAGAVDLVAREQLDKKINKSGWSSNKFLGTNESGNIIEKDAPEGESIPNGGTTGQVLTKKSNSDKDVSWADPTTTVQDGSIEEIKFSESLRKRKASFYNSVEEMKSDVSLKDGMTAVTLGYYKYNDGGGAKYLIRIKTEGDIDDGGSIHVLNNGNVAELIIENYVIPELFGVKADGESDDSEAINKAINYCYENNINCLNLMCKIYYLKQPIHLISNISIRGYCPVTEYSGGTVLLNKTCDIIDLSEDLEFMTISNIEFRGEWYTVDSSLFSGNGSIRYSKVFDCAFVLMKKVFDNTNLIGCTFERIMIDSVIDGGIITGSDNFFYKWFFALSKTNENYENEAMIVISCRMTHIDSIYFTGCQPSNSLLGCSNILELKNCNTCTVLRCNFTYARKLCLRVTDCRNVVINENNFAGWGEDENQKNCFAFQNSKNILVFGNNFDKADNWDIKSYEILYPIGSVSCIFTNNNYYQKPVFNSISSGSGKEILIDEKSVGIYSVSEIEISAEGNSIIYNGNGNNILLLNADTLYAINSECKKITIFFKKTCTCDRNVILKNGNKTAEGFATFLKRADGKYYEIS